MHSQRLPDNIILSRLPDPLTKESLDKFHPGYKLVSYEKPKRFDRISTVAKSWLCSHCYGMIHKHDKVILRVNAWEKRLGHFHLECYPEALSEGY
jgi:hypothetical protein